MAELLSPAGSGEALQAAVQCGADAVYLGAGDFNARRGAKNFTTDEELRRAVEYCHLRGVKVYLTLNTLLGDRELSEAAELLYTASACGVDAVLVQDWGVYTLGRAIAPDLPFHASTQMSLHTASGAEFAAAQGLERIVLSRELSGGQIAEICRRCAAQIEVFAHGALCMCYSGQCAMSALIGQRSGNRGRCAQPCRLPYGVNRPAADGYPLSLKDANLSAYLGRLDEMGVACLKLEGRMKRPEYVAVVTDIYRRLLDEKRLPTREENAALDAAFSRSGFTDGYYLGKKGPQMFGTRPEHTPEPKELFAQARKLYEKDDRRTVAVTMEAMVRRHQPLSLTVSDGVHTCTVTAEPPQEAQHRAITAQEVDTRLRKSGGTVFCVKHIDLALDEGVMVSAAALNGLRRSALEALAQARIAPPTRRTCPLPPAPCDNSGASGGKPELTVSVARIEQLSPALVSRAALTYVPAELLDAPQMAALWEQGRFCAVLPRIFSTDDEAYFRRLLQDHPRLAAVAVGNAGHLPVVEGLGLEIRGDFGLNVFNSPTLAFWKERGLGAATVSFELRHQQIRDLVKPLPCEAIVYGRLPLMVTENCPIGNAGGCRGEKKLCRGENYLTDRTGARFPLLGQYGCRCEIENALPLYLADKGEWQHLGLRWVRLRFTTEDADECCEIFSHYADGAGQPPDAFTRGLFYRGVE